MKTRICLLVLSLFIVHAGCVWAAGEFGTPAEAKAMLEKAVAEVKKDKAQALSMFTKGEGGFKDRDLYPYCGGSDGNFSAHPSLVGKSLKELKDKAGFALGEEIYAKAKEGTILSSSTRMTTSGYLPGITWLLPPVCMASPRTV